MAKRTKTEQQTAPIRVAGQGWEMRPVREIVPYARNAKIHSEEQITRLRQSMREFGFVRPLLIDEQSNLLAGHGALEAAVSEGMEEVPCVVVRGLTETQRKAYILADNKLAELAQWDDSLLRQELQEVAGAGISLEDMGFDMDMLADEPDALDLEDEPERSVDVRSHYHCPKCGFEFDA